MRRLLTALLLLASCKNYDVVLDNRPCDEDNACLAGYVCSINRRCVREGTAAACQPHTEIACNGIDEDCNGVDQVETGTLENCGGCNDGCSGAFVAQAACVTLTCTITRCDAGHVNADNDVSNGCEKTCDNVDGDNLCDSEDPCIDKDGDGLGTGAGGNLGCAITAIDSNDDNAQICADNDNDGCNDCSSGTFAPANDGTDRNGNGQCNVTDTDEDDDGVPHASDSDDDDPTACQDLDGDGCNDCSRQLGAPSVSNDGPDFDADGICDAGDPDDDNDTVLDPDDSDDASNLVCQDLDGDGCDDCAKFATYSRPNVFDDGTYDVDRDGLCGEDPIDVTDNPLADCDDGIPTCAHDCADSTGTSGDADNHSDCLQAYCREFSGGNAAQEVCKVVRGPTGAQLIAAMNTPRAGNPMPTFIIIDSDIDIDGPLPSGVTGPSGTKLVIHQRAGAKIRVALPTDGDVFHFLPGAEGNEFYGLTIVPNGPTSRIDSVFHFENDNNIVQDTVIDGFDRRGIYVDGRADAKRSGNVFRRNIIGGGLADQDDSNIDENNGTGHVVIRFAASTQIIGNIFTGAQMSAITIAGSDGLVISNNTFFMVGSSDEGSSLNFVDPASTNSCARSNLFLNDDGMQRVFRYESANNTTWDLACTGDNLVSSAFVDLCDFTIDAAGSDCSALPAGLIAATGTVGVSGFISTSNPDAPGFLCLKRPLVDQSTAVSGIDYNERLQANPLFPYLGNTFNGTAPEHGAREYFTPYCP